MQNEICANCGQVRERHYDSGACCNIDARFEPSGNVSVPASFIDKVRALCEGLSGVAVSVEVGMKLHPLYTAVREALAEIDKGVMG